MTQQAFAPKDAETIKSEILTDLGVEYEGNEETVDKLVARELKNEEFKASLHQDKVKHKEKKDKYEEALRQNGIDPVTLEKVDDGTPSQLSVKDIKALQDVHEEDVDDILDYAKFKKITIAEAKNAPTIKSLLKVRQEERKTAEATSVTTQKRGSSANTAEVLLNRVEKQEEMSPEEMRQAAKAIVAGLRKK